MLSGTTGLTISRRWVGTLFSIAVATIITATGYGVLQTWNLEENISNELADEREVDRQLAEWISIVEWSHKVGLSLINSDVPSNSIMGVTDSFAPVAKKVEQIRNELYTGNSSKTNRDLIHETDRYRNQWQLQWREALIHRLYTPSTIGNYEAINQANHSKLTTTSKHYLTALRNYQRYVHTTHTTQYHTVLNKLQLMLISLGIIGLLFITLISSKIHRVSSEDENSDSEILLSFSEDRRQH